MPSIYMVSIPLSSIINAISKFIFFKIFLPCINNIGLMMWEELVEVVRVHNTVLRSHRLGDKRSL